jgi:hypothetical protein
VSASISTLPSALIKAIARDQGDTLDASELQDLEQKMASSLAENEEEEAAHQERIANKPVSHSWQILPLIIVFAAA